jgi:pimeloyl-ACP methyl ester carboxylesterase
MPRRRPRPAVDRETRTLRLAEVFSVDLPGDRRLTGRRWAGHGDPLVLIHGLFDSSEGWTDLAARTGRPCLAIDLPGFGGSDLPAAPRIESYADDVAFALGALGVRGATLVGHSLGGAVAAAVAERSSSVASLVLVAPAGFGRIPVAEMLTLPGIIDLATLALPLALVNPLVVSASYAAFVGRGRLPDRRLVARLRSGAAHAPRGVRAAVLAIAASGREDQRRLHFGGRVGVLWGSDDALVPVSHAAGVRTAFPQAEVDLRPGMGHHPQQEHLAALVALVERYAGGAETAAAA